VSFLDDIFGQILRTVEPGRLAEGTRIPYSCKAGMFPGCNTAHISSPELEHDFASL
jgi:hypothetical protein